MDWRPGAEIDDRAGIVARLDPENRLEQRNSGHNGSYRRHFATFGRRAAAMLPVVPVAIPRCRSDSPAQ